MNILLTLILTIAVLIIILIAVVQVAIKEKRLNKDYQKIIEAKDNVINTLYKNAEKVIEINKEKAATLEELENAKTEEEQLAIIGNIINSNNERLQKH